MLVLHIYLESREKWNLCANTRDIFGEISAFFKKMSEIFREMSEIFEEMSEILEEMSEKVCGKK
jgi:hypothetical protein